jgi:hypothetical protein
LEKSSTLYGVKVTKTATMSKQQEPIARKNLQAIVECAALYAFNDNYMIYSGYMKHMPVPVAARSKA